MTRPVIVNNPAPSVTIVATPPPEVVVSVTWPQGNPGVTLVVTLTAVDYPVDDRDDLSGALPGCDVVTLPDPTIGRAVQVKATTAPVAITGTEDIDTEASVTLDPWEALTVTATGTTWVIV